MLNMLIHVSTVPRTEDKCEEPLNPSLWSTKGKTDTKLFLVFQFVIQSTSGQFKNTTRSPEDSKKRNENRNSTRHEAMHKAKGEREHERRASIPGSEERNERGGEQQSETEEYERHTGGAVGKVISYVVCLCDCL